MTTAAVPHASLLVYMEKVVSQPKHTIYHPMALKCLKWEGTRCKTESVGDSALPAHNTPNLGQKSSKERLKD